MHRTPVARHARLAVVLAACTLLGCSRATDIGDLLAHPEQYDGQEVKVRGTVMNAMRIPIVDVRVYNVQDRTGEMVVVTSGPLPTRGEKISVTGTFTTLGHVNGQSFGPHLRVDEVD